MERVTALEPSKFSNSEKWKEDLLSIQKGSAGIMRPERTNGISDKSWNKEGDQVKK